MVGQALEVSVYAGGYIAEIEGEVVAGTSLEDLEGQLRERGYTEANMPILESIPPRGTNLF